MATTKIGTVRTTTPTTPCPGTAYQTSTGAGCSACADRGLGASLTGTSASTCITSGQSPCCNLPYFFLAYSNTTVLQYAFLEFNILPNVHVCVVVAAAAAGSLTSPKGSLRVPSPPWTAADRRDSGGNVLLLDADHHQRRERHLDLLHPVRSLPCHHRRRLQQLVRTMHGAQSLARRTHPAPPGRRP